MDVVFERDRRVAELADPLARIEAACQSDLDDAFTERSEVRDDVDIAGADVRDAVVDLLDRLRDFVDLRFHPPGGVVLALVEERGHRVLVMLALLLEPLPLALHLLLHLALLAQAITLLAFGLLLLSDLREIVRS